MKSFKGILFESASTNAIYLWNSEQVICVKEAPRRTLGQIMKGFNDLDFGKIYDQKTKSFLVGRAIYKILKRI